MQDLLPFGFVHYLVGGLLIGAGIGFVYLLTGKIAGISSFLTAAQSWWSRRPVFRSAAMVEERAWKGVLVLGLIAGAAAWAFATDAWFVTGVQWWRLVAGGLLVGFGTRTARGCTSGHGICGMSAVAAPSITSTLVFMGVAFVTARLVMLAGVTP